MKLQNPGLVVAKVVTAMMLLVGLGRLPYDYYTLLRWVVCGVTTFAAVRAFQAGKGGWVWAFAIVAVTFNPILPLRLSRDTWGFFDVGVAGLLVVSIATVDRKRVSP